MAIKYKYAYDKNNIIINIANATKDNNYYCISCNDMMIARQGAKNKWHFSHKNEYENCLPESYLHKLAKQKFYEIYKNCLENKEPFYIELSTKTKHEPCEINNKLKACRKCDYEYEERKKYDLTKIFKNIEIEKSVGNFRADLLLSNSDNSEIIFIEIYVSNKISDNKQNSKYRIIEIDVENEDDIKLFFDKLLSMDSLKITFFNFKNPTKIIPNNGMCEKTFLLLFLNKEGNVLFNDNLTLQEIYKKLLNKKDNIVKYLISNQFGSSIYKYFIAYCSNKNLFVKNCFICRYHAINNSFIMFDENPIFCKFLKEKFKSTNAVKCQYFKKEDKYIGEYLNYSVR
ncbi:MAG: competence protein CoiA [Alphaproteobacteria bacterium]|jgi:hypothetical protein|nr:competence protein CoiA [Alphaproteobacteria bacterium]